MKQLHDKTNQVMRLRFTEEEIKKLTSDTKEMTVLKVWLQTGKRIAPILNKISKQLTSSASIDIQRQMQTTLESIEERISSIEKCINYQTDFTKSAFEIAAQVSSLIVVSSALSVGDIQKHSLSNQAKAISILSELLSNLTNKFPDLKAKSMISRYRDSISEIQTNIAKVQSHNKDQL